MKDIRGHAVIIQKSHSKRKVQTLQLIFFFFNYKYPNIHDLTIYYFWNTAKVTTLDVFLVRLQSIIHLWLSNMSVLMIRTVLWYVTHPYTAQSWQPSCLHYIHDTWHFASTHLLLLQSKHSFYAMNSNEMIKTKARSEAFQGTVPHADLSHFFYCYLSSLILITFWLKHAGVRT